MRLDWIFLPRENLCAKFYIIIIIIINASKQAITVPIKLVLHTIIFVVFIKLP